MSSEVAVTISGLEWVRGKKEPLESFGRLQIRDWEDDALADRDTFASNLRLLGMSDEAVFEALDIRDAEAKEFARAAAELEPYRDIRFLDPPPGFIEAVYVYNSARESARRHLRDWWNRRVTIIETTEPLEVDIPLFVLGTPIVPGCKSEWTNQTEFHAGGGWSLRIAGSGLGSDVDVAFIESASFEACNGETKLIFCRVVVQLERIEISEPRKPTTRQWRVDVAGLNDHMLLPGLLLLDPDAVPNRGESVARYLLAGDPSGSMASYTYKYAQTRPRITSAGIDVNGTKLGLSATSTFASSVEIKYTLKTGADYELFRAESSEGLLFGTAEA